MATEKTSEGRKHSAIAMRDAEREATDAEYAERLLRDMKTVIGTARHLYTAQLLDALFALPTGPWRKFRGTGLTDVVMARLLDPFGIRPRLIKTNSKRKTEKVARGYRRDDILHALAQFGGE